ncbi:MAG TPA: glycerophosphodiester phosphodiesterase, partial [Herpetosiphonaceae bacterium]|nr:glycerophosphodiester phosphodiesterase [Herpetosiphonaceae bacterium]
MELIVAPALDSSDYTLARRYAPIIRFDAAEPFLPTCAGYTIFRAGGPSPSFPRYVPFDSSPGLAIEYAVWWDWDIQHLYELEHVWVFVDRQGTAAAVESSQHGAFSGGDWEREGDRPVLYAEPGKHALHTATSRLLARRERTERSCGARAGAGGVWITPLYQRRIAKTPDADQLVRTYLRRHAFTPSWVWSRYVDVADLPLMPWPLLDAAIPGIVATRVAELEAAIPRDRRHVWHVGHRGASAHAPENTLAAIRKAADLGAHMVELDVRLSADGVAVLAHDAAVTRPEQGVVAVNALTATELQQTTPTAETAVPTLADALELCAQLGLGPYLELKEAGAVEPVVAELTGRGLARHSVVGSFNPAWVARTTELAPHIATAILFGGFDVDPIALARGTGAQYVHPCWERHP